MIDLLSCKVMPYAWGSRTAIAGLRGLGASAGPEAELWMGAHPLGPSKVNRGGRERSLTDLVAEDPAREMGHRARDAFGARLPFLLKVLAAAQPLSLQAHPTEAQARAGYADEENRGVPLDAPNRNYKDPCHKPELICALTPFDALCGFRRVEDTLRLFDELGVRELAAVLTPLRRSPDQTGLAETFRAIMTTPQAARAAMVDATVAACLRPGGTGFERERAWAVKLAGLYPGDVGVVSALLLNLVHLSPGEAIFMGAGNLHAYLEGVGIEIMASSDNVLRGGLTPKHVDVPELMNVLDFTYGPMTPVRPREVDAVENVYDAPVREFRLSTLRMAGAPSMRETLGPEILLCTEGSLHVGAEGKTSLEIKKGDSVFVSGSARHYTVQGDGLLYRATTNLA
ncbi:Mannose-6-phosphate isomerase [Labilithrix luteola]|uniref:mannose-6-phosphate isomerase n=1 Tax=Labilithrix luteola TaxID=1391654 RepID=A0A0K1PMB0_9BACT|nr:mannose-6-phosphate isomerase, class I [Labilithrix luteola]AKU94224.1 Mannose-6-phosphate isomerase [Labilithrix luteola]